MSFFKKDTETYRIIGLLGSFGFTTAGAMAVGFFVGSYLDKKYNTSPWFVIILVVLGLIGGFLKFFQVIKQVSNEQNKKHSPKK